MGVFKISKSKKSAAKTEMIREDLFHTEAQLSMDQTIKSYRPKVWSIAFGFVAASFIFGIFGYLFLHSSESKGPNPYVFFEMKAIDEEGHPLAGADVSFNGDNLGVTDSFGEWRRFIRVGLGSQVILSFSKKTRTGAVLASRKFSVPMQTPNEGEIELSGTIQLLTAAKKATKKAKDLARAEAIQVEADRRREAAEFAEENPDVVYDDGIDSINIMDMPDVSEIDVSEEKSKSLSENLVARTSPYDSISIHYSAMNGISPSLGDIKSSKRLQQKILPAIIKRSKDLGLTVSTKSQWKVEIEHLSASSTKGGAGLILVSATTPGSDRKIRFLRNYKKNNLSTARSILYGLKLHVAREYRTFKKNGEWFVQAAVASKKFWSLTNGTKLFGKRGSSATVLMSKKSKYNKGAASRIFQLKSNGSALCGKKSKDCFVYKSHVGINPPVKKWSRLKVRLFGVSAAAKVFISGYQAIHEGGKVWSYWGQAGSRANLTVVHKGRIAFRKKIKSKSKSHIVPLPGRVVSRR